MTTFKTIPNLARAMLAFAEGFAQLAAHFGAPAGTVAVEVAPEAAKPAEKEENPAPAPVSAPAAEKAPETAVSASDEPPPPTPPTPPAPLTEDGLRRLVIRAFESGHGGTVTAFLASAGVQRVTQLDAAGRQSLADKLAKEEVAGC